MTSNVELAAWVEEVVQLTKPEAVHWCSGSEEENSTLINLMENSGDLIKLNQDTHPNCYLHRSDPKDVARVEHLTFVCTEDELDAGPNNNWLEPSAGHTKIDKLFDGCMEGRTMYVIPYLMGPYGSPYARAGVEVTDSPYVVVNMRIMARIGLRALEHIENGNSFVKGMHSLGDLDPDRRLIMHFPEELSIKSIGSGYGGNALLGKKCHALRIASSQARSEGWLAEHMLILGMESPAGETKYVAAAFPSACGKTNLAMLVPPKGYEGWKIWTVGDDIAWMHLGPDGQLWAINPEAGFFGVAPGTSLKTNPNCMNTLGKNAIYTNVAVTKDMQPWWEGIDGDKPDSLVDWQARPHDLELNGPAAHPNSRFTVSAGQCPSFSSKGNSPAGVPISAIIFGGRRATVSPLVYEAFDWDHGVFTGAAMASETTAAAAGATGQVRRDPMAMKPFCGYNFADYWQHWLSFSKKSDNLPKIFHVNWFRKNENGEFIWPGFGENMRVLEWILGRCAGDSDALETPIGFVPRPEAINFDGLELTRETVSALLGIDSEIWANELSEIETYFETYSGKLPESLRLQLERVKSSFAKEAVA
tara:strand:- start:257 stop:2020 length:1764 start_codon:yes stop_codon:yes gene_type:complete